MKEDMKKVFLPRGRKNEENFVLVSVNGRSYKIMKGVEVEVLEQLSAEHSPPLPLLLLLHYHHHMEELSEEHH